MEYAKSGMRLDPLNPAAYLVRMGLAHLCMGEWKEAVEVTEKALKLRPELRGLGVSVLSSAYAHLGRYEEAKAALETYSANKVSSFGPAEPLMYALPFKDRETAESFLENLKKAGLIKPGPEYIHVSREDQVTGKDLKAFYYPSKITGYSADGSQRSQEFAENGTVIFRAPGLPGGVDTGKSWLQGDKIWLQFQNYMSGMPYCRTTFKNPRGTPEQKNEYVSYSDVQLIKFSRMQ
jgi:tetratricopeptide (TPR) repeat protein